MLTLCSTAITVHNVAMLAKTILDLTFVQAIAIITLVRQPPRLSFK